MVLFLSHLRLGAGPVHKKLTPPKSVVLRGLSREQFAKNRGEPTDSRRADAKPPPKKPEKPPPTQPPGQVVDTAPGNQQIDPNAKYASETNNAVKKETRAKETTAFYKNAMPQRTAPKPVDGAGADAAEASQVAGNDGRGADDQPMKEKASQQRLTMEVPDVKARSEVALKSTNDTGPGIAVGNREESEAVAGNSNRFKLQPGTPGQGEETSLGRRGAPGILTLLPSPAVLDKIAGAAANDHLRDVDEGDGTYLNTREWKYAGFFNRVKQSVGQQWNPQQQLRARDPSHQIYGGKDRYTLLTVTLNADGRVTDAYVEKSSGLDFLDVEAIKAFERAQPFPNPPPGLLAADMTVRFQFGFFLELSGRGMQLFRAAD
ncbi:MAG: energy transducer TonB [Archangium sp.]|nr:energy transducer TonB [Archangium sp.]